MKLSPVLFVDVPKQGVFFTVNPSHLNDDHRHEYTFKKVGDLMAMNFQQISVAFDPSDRVFVDKNS